VKEGAAGDTAENQGQDELDGDRVEVLRSKEQTAQLPGEAPMRPAAKPHNVFQMFARNKQRQDSRVELV
jgi:lipopolysaccharide export system protein LptA